MPHGFLGTRADALIDVVLLCVLANPLVFILSFRLARARKYEYHRRLQVYLLATLLFAVVLFEVDVRLSGGSGSLMRGSTYAGTAWLRFLLLAHVTGAVSTFLLWLVLAVLSLRRFRQVLPGSFSQTHRWLGLFVLAGNMYTAVSAILMYVCSFIL